MSRTLEMRKIQEVSRKRKTIGLSFAFHTDSLWISDPSQFGDYLISAKERDLFLELLDDRCTHLERRDGELIPIG